MKILEHLKSLNKLDFDSEILGWYENRYLKSVVAGQQPTDPLDCLITLLKWLDEEYEEPLELCPFLCVGCNRKVETEIAPNKLWSVTPDYYGKEACAVDGTSGYKTEAEAIAAWNNAVRGRKCQAIK